MTLYPHQHRALVLELRREFYAGLAADDAYAKACQAIKRLGSTRFLTAERLERLPAKLRPALFVLVTDDELAQFPSGIPGFPNKLRREWFDAAWREVTGG